MDIDSNSNSRRKGRKDLTNGEKQRIYEFLLENSVEERLHHGLLIEAATMFKICTRTIK